MKGMLAAVWVKVKLWRQRESSKVCSAKRSLVCKHANLKGNYIGAYYEKINHTISIQMKFAQ